jgi:hypothetical protein
MNRNWHYGDAQLHYLYADQHGRIIGETALLGHARRGMHSCTVYPTPTESITLGVYVTSESAKNAIESYWFKKDNTLDNLIESKES